MDFTNERPNAYPRGVGLRFYRGLSIVEQGQGSMNPRHIVDHGTWQRAGPSTAPW